LLAQVLEVERSYLIAHSDRELTLSESQSFVKLLHERQTGKPIAYILGKKGFWTFELEVNEHTLVPRPETELLVEQALKLLPENKDVLVADICTGSGAIALAIASEKLNASLIATDLDEEALKTAERNRKNLGLNNVEYFHGDLYAALPDTNKKYNMIVSNPPYIDKDDVYLTHVTMQHEPRHALVAEDNGMAIIERLIKDCHLYLKQEGYLILEHGHEQRQAIEALCKEHHLNYTLGCQDYQALDRISVIQYR